MMNGSDSGGPRPLWLTREGQPLYLEESGHPGGIPVLVLHGGPGAGSNPSQRTFFNPDHYRVFLHDQRGCGQSINPELTIESNTTQALLKDLCFIQDQLGIRSWVLFGGSWGASLALLFAAQWPERVSGLILRGTFLARQKDLDWFLAPDGVRRFFPEAWRDFELILGAGKDSPVIHRVHAALFGEDPQSALAMARAWEQWGGVVTLGQALRSPMAEDDPRLGRGLLQARIELHYARHHYFIKENQILDQVSKIQGIPVIMVHGRMDWVCPVGGAFELHQALSGSELVVLDRSGHVPADEEMIVALQEATDRLYGRLQANHA